MMRVSIWHGALIVIIISAAVLILLSLFAGPLLSGIIVETVGAFLGVFAAIVLGEILKSRDNSQLAKRVREELEEEISLLVSKAKKTPDNPGGYETPYWNASVAAGELGVLDSEVRRLLYTCYNAVKLHTLYSHQCQDRADQPGSTRQRAEHYRQLAIRSNEKMLQHVSNTLNELFKHEET